MTITKIPTAHQQSIFSFLDEWDLHFAWRSCKALQRTAGDNRLWKLFLTKRAIEPTENNKQRLTAYFKCSCRYFARNFPNDFLMTRVEHCAHQKRTQFLMDVASQTKSNMVILSHARIEEMGWKYIDIYDLHDSIFKAQANFEKSKELWKTLEYIGSSLKDVKDPDHARFLLEFKPKLNSWYDITPIGSVIANSSLKGEPAIVKMLIDAKADVHAKSTWFRSYGTNTEGLLNHALAHDIDIPEVARDRLSVGLHPVRTVSTELVRILLEAGARPTRTVVKDRGRFLGSLHLAVSLNLSYEILLLLVKAGATRTLATPDWPGTLELAKLNGYPAESIQLLEEAAGEIVEMPALEAAVQAPALNQQNLPDIQIEPPALPVEVLPAAPLEPDVAADDQLPILPPVQQQDLESEAPNLANLLRQTLPAWLWDAFVAIDGFIRLIVTKIVNFFNQNDQ